MNKIKQYRKRHKLSQRKLAELLHVNVRSVQRWESGERTPHKMVLMLITKLQKEKYGHNNAS
jgi:DNA-binding transcriptional regulator YiaG